MQHNWVVQHVYSSMYKFLLATGLNRRVFRFLPPSSLNRTGNSSLHSNTPFSLTRPGQSSNHNVQVYLCFSPSRAIYFEASHWPWDHMISFQASHFPPLPICTTMLAGSVLLPNTVNNQNKCGRDQRWSEPRLKHSAGRMPGTTFTNFSILIPLFRNS